MNNIRVLTKKKNGFQFKVAINQEKKIIHCWLHKFPNTYANITIGELMLDDNGDFNVTKKVIVPMFKEVPKDTNGNVTIRSISKCHPDDEWKAGIGIDLAVKRCYSKAYKLLKESIMKSIGNPE